MRRALAGALATLLCLTANASPGDDLFGRTLATVEVVGVPGADRLAGLVALREGRPLTRHALGQALRNLHRLGLFDRISASGVPDGDRVHLVIRLEAIRRITRVGFVGARSLDEKRLLRAADLPSGLQFSPDVVEAAARRIAAEYFREGYRDVQVRWDALPAGTGQVAIDLSIAEGDPTTLVRLEFEGDAGLSRGELLAAFDLTPGSVLSMNRLDQGIEELRERYRQRAFFNARVATPRVEVADNRAVVVIELAAGPRFVLQVRGHRAFDERTLLARTGYRGKKPLDEAARREFAQRIQAFYELAGYPHARVEARQSSPPQRPAVADAVSHRRRSVSADPWGEQLTPAQVRDDEPPTSGERLVTFLVREGDPVRVVERRFEGVTRFGPRELIDRIDATLRDAAPPELTSGRDPAALHAAWISGAPDAPPPARRDVRPEEVFATAPYQAACSQIADLYRSRGHLDAVVGPARLEMLQPGTARVVIPVVEGPQTTVRAVTIQGASQVPRSQLAPIPTLKPGDPLSFFAVEESRQALVSAYQSRGFLYVQVEDEEHIDEATSEATVLFRVVEGVQVRVQRVELRGLVRTDPKLVLDSLALGEGDFITPAALQDSVRSLLELGLFSSASVEPADPEQVASQKVLVVELREKPSRRLEVRLGASRADGPRTSAAWVVGNLAGRNETFLLSGKLNWPFPRVCAQQPESCSTTALPDVPLERRINLSLVLPHYGGMQLVPADMRFDALHENLLRPAFHLQRYAGVVSFDGLLRRKVGPAEVSALLQVELEHDEFRRRVTLGTPVVQSLADQRAQLLPEGRILLVSARPAFTVDLRDDRANPTSGLLASLSFDVSRSLSAELAAPGDTIELLRTMLSASGWIPLSRARRVVVAVSGRFGGILKADDSVVIGTKRFFLGGTQTLRGFNEDNVVPQDVRERMHDAVARCRALSSGLGCTGQVREMLGGSPATSEGGELMMAGRLELRFGLAAGVDAALFADAGNLWLEPSEFDPFELRTSSGAGLRFATPIGPAAVDVGWNMTRDEAVSEPLVRLHFSVGSF